MHIMNAESAHSLGRGGKILTSILNRQGLALSYPKLRRYQYDIATYTVQQNEHEVALPAHFDPGEFTSSAFDNWDHEGTNVSEHDTVCVLFQDRTSSQRFKPKRSDTLVEHGPQAFKETLPCQILQEFESYVKRANLPRSFKGNAEPYTSDDTETKKLTDIAWSMGHLNLDIKDKVDRIVYPEQQTMPSWSANNAVWTDENVPLKQVVFLPVLPYPVTLYSAVLGGCPFHGRVERDEIPTRESPPKQSGTLPCPALHSTPVPSTPLPPLCLPAAVHLNAHRV